MPFNDGPLTYDPSSNRQYVRAHVNACYMHARQHFHSFPVKLHLVVVLRKTTMKKYNHNNDGTLFETTL